MDNSLIIFYCAGVSSVLICSFLSNFIFIYYNTKISKRVFYFLSVCFIYTLFAQLFKYYSMHFYTDFSHWTNLLYNIVSTGYPYSQAVELTTGALNYLSIHFVPLIYLVAIPFKFFPYSETLIVTNFLLMLSAGIPLFKLSNLYKKDSYFGLFMVVLLFWYTPFQYAVLYEFEMLRFSVPILLWMLYFWEKKKMNPFYLFVVLALLVREEMGLVIFMFGLYLIVFEKKRQVGLVTSLIGILGFFLITQIIMPELRDDEYQHIAMGSFNALGGSVGEIIINIFTKPIFVLKTVFEPNLKLVIKLANIFMFFLPLLFISFYSPSRLFPILSIFGIGFISAAITHSSYMLYYTSPTIPFIFYAFIKGWPKFVLLLKKLSLRYVVKNERINFDSVAVGVVVISTLVTNIIFSPSPISLQFWSKNLRPAPFETQNHHYSAFIVNEHHKIVKKFVNIIPDSAIVAAPGFLLPRLYKKRSAVYLNPRESSFELLSQSNDESKNISYIFYDTKNNNLELPRFKVVTNMIQKYIESNKQYWELVKSEDGYFLYIRKNKSVVYDNNI